MQGAEGDKVGLTSGICKLPLEMIGCPFWAGMAGKLNGIHTIVHLLIANYLLYYKYGDFYLLSTPRA
jgi:hypothetical protein